jgi:hypothetical protein
MLRSGCKALHPVAQLRSMTGSCRRQQSPATSEWARRRATHPAARPYSQTYTTAARLSTGARYPRAASSAPNSLRLPRRPIIAAPHCLPKDGRLRRRSKHAKGNGMRSALRCRMPSGGALAPGPDWQERPLMQHLPKPSGPASLRPWLRWSEAEANAPLPTTNVSRSANLHDPSRTMAGPTSGCAMARALANRLCDAAVAPAILDPFLRRCARALTAPAVLMIEKNAKTVHQRMGPQSRAECRRCSHE